MKDSWGALPGTSAVRVDASIFERTADSRGKTLAKGLSPEDEQKCAPLVRVAQERELAAWEELFACSPVSELTFTETSVGARWASTWEVTDGRTMVKARLVI